MGKNLGFVLALLGCLLAVPAIVGLIQELQSAGLTPPLQEFMDFYAEISRRVFRPVFNLIETALGWVHIQLTLPEWFGHLLVLDALICTLFTRVFYLWGSGNKWIFTHYGDQGFEDRSISSSVALFIILPFIWCILFFTFLSFLYGAILILTMFFLHRIALEPYVRKVRSEWDNPALGIFLRLLQALDIAASLGWATAVGVIVFYVANHLMQSGTA